MDLRHLEYVVELSRARSVTKAAANLGVAQPAISQAISGLERQYGVTLFDRTSRPVQPTPAGVVFIEQAGRVLGELKKLRDVADAHATLVRGKLTIGTTYWVGETMLPPILVDFHKLYAGITLALRREPVGRLVEAVRSGQLDVAFIESGSSPQLGDLECHPIYLDEIVVFVPPYHSLATRTAIELPDLGTEPFIGYDPESSIYAPFAKACKEAGFVPNVIATSQSQAVARSLVSLGMGISVGSKTFLEGPGLPVHAISIIPRLTKDTLLILRAGPEANNITRPFTDYVLSRLAGVPASA
jgi:LysR family hydrogen peroxide-inducible transcriptional activator